MIYHGLKILPIINNCRNRQLFECQNFYSFSRQWLHCVRWVRRRPNWLIIMDEMEEKQRQKTETETNKKLRQNICVQSICCAKMNKKNSIWKASSFELNVIHYKRLKLCLDVLYLYFLACLTFELFIQFKF